MSSTKIKVSLEKYPFPPSMTEHMHTHTHLSTVIIQHLLKQNSQQELWMNKGRRGWWASQRKVSEKNVGKHEGEKISPLSEEKKGK